MGSINKINHFMFADIIREQLFFVQSPKTYSAGSIVLPKLDNMREQVQSEIQAKAEQKSELLEVQKQYAKQYRVSVHQWSYGRLISMVQSQAAKTGIVIEEAKQPIRGSPQEKAKELAIAAYHSRKIN